MGELRMALLTKDDNSDSDSRKFCDKDFCPHENAVLEYGNYYYCQDCNAKFFDYSI